MIKKLLNLFSLSCLLISSISIAQPTLTANGLNPVIGDNYESTTSSYFNQGAAGANQIWDFSAFTGTSNGISNGVSVSSTPHASSFNNANFSFYTAQGGTYSFYKTSSTSSQFYGVATSSGILIPYSNPEDYLRFPFTFNNSFVDTWETTITNGVTFYRTGKTTVTADGYGTLKTAAGTYNNVTRIYSHQVYQDSADFSGTPFLIYYDNKQYIWYANGIHVPIASTYTFTSSQGAPSQGSSYLSSIVSTNDFDPVLSTSSLFPNPASDKIILEFTLTETKTVDIILLNAIGQSVNYDTHSEGIQGHNALQLDIATLPKGIYYAQILLEGTIAASKKFVIAK